MSFACTAGQECADALRTVTKNIENNMPSIKDKFEASFLEDNDFYLLVADSAAEAVQYGTLRFLLLSLLMFPFTSVAGYRSHESTLLSSDSPIQERKRPFAGLY